MAEHKVGYTKGLNKDLAKDKYSNQHYFDANNIRIVTNKGLSTGSIENEKGNKLLFSFPTIGRRIKLNLEEGVTSGSVTINGNVIAYTTSDNNDTFYNNLISTVAIATLINDGKIYIFLNDTGVYIQIIDTTVTSSFTNTTGSAGSEYSASTSSIYICGWCVLNEWIIVFTSNSETVEPTSALCQIWKLKFQDGSRTQIDGATGTVLNAVNHLIYNDYLNYSTITYIRDTVTNYETSSKGRVYWTDYFNQIRVINIFDEELMSKKTTDLDLISEITLVKPIIQTINNTGTVPSGSVVQYYYKQLSTDGRETIFSPGSQVMNLYENNTNDLSLSYSDYDATAPNSLENKSITIELTGLDTDYNIIEYYVVIWLNKNSPLIYKIGEDIVDGENKTFSHSTMSDAILIDYASFMEIGVPFTAKTIEDRDKALAAANIKEVSFDVDFDARAYRFNTDATPNFDLYNANGTFENYTAATIATIDEEHDAINPTNDDTNTTYNYENLTNRQIYQSDGVTIGGEGLNISYTFTTNERSASVGAKQLETSGSDDTAYNSTDQRAGVIESNLGELNPDGSSILYNIQNELNSSKSNKLNAIATGYARGEVYRFGVVFFSKQGQRSFVKWIGDIKMPDPTLSDDYKIQDSDNATTNQFGNDDSNVSMYEIGVEFSIDVSSIVNEISGFKFVVVERTQSDKTRLGTGIVTNFVDWSDGDTNPNNELSLLRKYVVDAGYSDGVNPTDRAISSIMSIFGITYGDDLTNSPNEAFTNKNLLLNDSPDITGLNGSLTLDDYSKYLLNLTSPESDFRQYTGFTSNPSTDFIRDYGYYTCYEQIYNDNSLNMVAGNANIKEAQLGFLYRAKQFYSLSDESQTAQNYLISAQRYLTTGEVIGNTGTALANSEDTQLLGTDIEYDVPGGTGIETVLNASYSFYDVVGDNQRPFGFGTRKQTLRLNNSPSLAFATAGTSLNYKELDNSDILNADLTALDAMDNYQGIKRYFKEVAYCRINPNQYGGNTYVARSKNEYKDTGHYQVVTNETGTSFSGIRVFGGDTYTVSYSREYMKQYWGNTLNQEYLNTSGTITRMSIAFMFCAECSVNIAYRFGEFWGGKSADLTNRYFHGSVDPARNGGDLSSEEVFAIYPLYQQENNVRTDYIAKDFLLDTTTIFPNRIKVSSLKIDGELTDNWRRFPINQFADVKGSLGEIHKLLAFKNNLLFFQDTGIGILPINERAIINDVTGASLVLGNGDLIGKHQYITETSGTRHQHSVVASDKTIYYYDSLQAKIYPIQDNSLTENLGLSSYFHNDLLEILRVKDDLYKEDPQGVHAVYDKKNERIFFTFLGGNIIKDDTVGYYDTLDIVLKGSTYYRCLIQGNYTSGEIVAGNSFEIITSYKRGVTISFNERLSNFESYYDFKPGNYLQYHDKVLSINHTSRNTVYIHEEDDYGKFYDNYYPSDIVLIVMPTPDIISIFNTIEYYSEISINKENIVGETLNSIHLFNNYQNTGKITLSVGSIAKQRVQTWRHKFKRDVIGTNGEFKPRMRNYYLLMKLRYDNNDNKRLVLSDITISYTPTKKM